MTSVFIGGSRAVSRLNDIIRDKLDDLISRQSMIFVGDANGADKAVQQHLANRGYGRVTVYCMEQCRNNLGNWPAKHAAKPNCKSGRSCRWRIKRRCKRFTIRAGAVR
jgi:hypothetical protein